MALQSILVVDDDSLSREFLVEACRSLGYRTHEACDGMQALEVVAKTQPDVVLTDMRMPKMDGTQLVEALHESYPEIASILVTAHGSVETAVQAMRSGAADFLLKPCSIDSIQMVLERMDRTSRMMRENEYLRSEVTSNNGTKLIAQSSGMLDTLRSASRIARSKGTVLITGESGTGKERVAQYIHQSSPRIDGPFIRVNCAALSEHLLESELFGHEKGAFTGATKTREGRFELADGGTLLLDEIGEISPALQAKLLRVLEEEEFERVGGSATLKVDVRVIATTNRDLSVEMKKGSFREDLYYRLHVLPVHMRPLRERTEDILPLCEHFASVYARENGKKEPVFSPEAIVQLSTWSWPGNVRELENTVQRAVVLLKNDVITPQDLVFGPASNTALDEIAPALPSPQEATEDTIAPFLANRTMADIERVAILATLGETRGNKTEAARRLGLTARTLSNKLKLWRQAGHVA